LTEKKPKDDLFNSLNTVISKAEKNFEKNHSKQDLQLKWGRLLVNAVATYGKLLDGFTIKGEMKLTQDKAIQVEMWRPDGAKSSE